MQVEGKVKYPHYRLWRPTGDVNVRAHIYTATALGRDRVSSPTLGHFTPGEVSGTHFIGR